MTLSFEFFPPKTTDGWASLYTAMGQLDDLNLDMVSVTYGAGGSTRNKTVDLVGRIQSELRIDTMAHLTCVGHSRYELFKILDNLKSHEIKAIMALRGDPPQGETEFVPAPKGPAHASDLIKFIRDIFDFHIGCACYPEGHIDNPDVDRNIEFLRLKQDNGANYAITQLFFINDVFYRFRDKAAAAGVTIPVIAGIMPPSSVKQLARFKELSGCTIPRNLSDLLSGCSREDAERRGRDFVTDQCDDLIRNGVAGLHLYTLNKSRSSDIVKRLQIPG